MKTSTNLLDLDDDQGPVAEILLLTISECFVYKIPPLRSASGHRTEEWDLANPLFTGCLRIYQADTKLRIIIYGFKDPQKQVVNDEHIVLFGECPIEVKPNESITAYVDGVVDSSRYYVVRIKDPKSTRTTNIGIGFREREQAFDFKNALNEYLRYLDRSQLAEQLSKLSHTGSLERPKDHITGEEGEDGYIQQEEFEDFIIHDTKQTLPIKIEHIEPLKEGQKIKVKLPSKANHTDHEGDETLNQQQQSGPDLLQFKKGSSGFGLKPPPPPGSTVATSTTTNNTTGSSVENDEEWGDFASGGL